MNIVKYFILLSVVALSTTACTEDYLLEGYNPTPSVVGNATSGYVHNDAPHYYVAPPPRASHPSITANASGTIYRTAPRYSANDNNTGNYL